MRVDDEASINSEGILGFNVFPTRCNRRNLMFVDKTKNSNPSVHTVAAKNI